MLKYYYLFLFIGFGFHGYGQSCLIPANPVSTNATNNSVDLIWDEVDNGISYNVKFRTSNSSSWQSANASANFFTLTGLSSGTKYYWQVRANCSEDGGISSDYSAIKSFTTTGTAACEAPTNLSVGSVTNQSATLAWEAISGASAYQVFFRANTAKKYSSVTVANNEYLLESINPGTEYVWYVKAICSNVLISSGSSISRFITPGASPCAAPVNLITTGVTTNNVELSWTDSGAESYIISYRVSTSPGYSKVISNTNNITLSALASGTRYVWYVQSVCASLTSTISDIGSFTTAGPSSCPTPNNLVTSQITASTAKLNWSATLGAGQYIVKYRSASSSTFTSLISNTNSISLTGLQDDNDYVFVVKAICSADISSQYSVAGRFTTLSSCPVPNNKVVSNITNTSAQFNWNVVAGGVSYGLRYKATKGTTWINKTTSSTNFSVAGLLPGTDYIWQLRTNCQSKVSDFSPEMHFTTTGEPTCGKPQNLTAANISENTALLTWSPANGALNYLVKYRPTNSANWNIATVSANSLAISGLVPGTDYVWVVSTNCDQISSEFVTAGFTTLGTPPCQAPVNLISSNVGTTSANLQWDMSENVLNYQIYYKIASTNNYSSVISNTNSIMLNNLTPGVSYYWYVTTNCTSGMTSAISQVENFATEGEAACAIPQNLNTFNIGDNTADLVWNAVAGADGYIVSYRPVNGSTYSKSTTIVNTKKISGLVPGTQYVWYVNTICNSLESLDSEVKGFTTTGTPACEAPIDLMSENNSANSVDLSWGAVDNAISYEVRYKPNSSSKYGYFTVETNSAFIPGLQPNTEYVWYVRTKCSATLSSPISQVLRFTTPAVENSVSSNQANLFSISSESTNIGIHFKDEASAEGYIIVYNANGEIIQKIDNMTATQKVRAIDISPAYNNSLLIVKFINNDGAFTKKIIFK